MPKTKQSLQRRLKQLSTSAKANPRERLALLLDLAEGVKNEDSPYGLSLSEEAYSLSQALKDPVAEARSLCCLCEINKQLGHISTALHHGQAGLEKARSLNQPAILVKQLIELAKVYTILEDNATGLEYLLEAMTLSQRHNLLAEEAVIFNMMGVLYSKQGDHKQELNSYLQAIDLYTQLNDQSGLAIMYNNVAMVYVSQGVYEVALLQAKKALRLISQQNKPLVYVTILCTIGEINLALKLYQEALDYLFKSLDLAQELSSPHLQIAASLVLGETYLAQGDIQAAKDHLFKALTWANESQSTTNQATAHHLLSQTFELASDYQTALKHHKKYHLLKESIFNKDADLRLKNLQVLHQTEIAQRQAKLMQAQNETLQSEMSFRKEAEAEAQLLAQQMTTLNEINRQISATLNLQQMLEKIVSLVCPALKASDGVVFVAPPGSQVFSPEAVSGLYEAEMQHRSFEAGQGILGDIVQHGQAEYVNQPSQDPRTRKLRGSWDEVVGSDDDLYPLIAAPFSLEDGSRGLICLWRHIDNGFFNDNDLNFLQGLAHQTVVAFSNAQLYAQARLAQKSAEASNRAKNNFLATMSHEFRTPLNAILGYAQVLNRDPSFNNRHLDAVNAILHSGQHLLSLVNDLLDLAKVEAGKMELVPSAFFLPDLLNTTAKIVRVRAVEKDLNFHLETDGNLTLLLHGDRRRLQQVLLNLINNAIKFTENGSVVLRVSLAGFTPFTPNERESELPTAPIGQVNLQFEVEDTGIGLDPADVAKIFTPFEQAQKSNQAQEGTGLGLAISETLLGLMDSYIQVSSTPGQGSIFSFSLTLPLIRSQHKRPQMMAHPKNLASSTPLPSPTTIHLPPPETIHTFLNLSLHGDIQALEEQKSALLLEDSNYAQFCEQVEQYCRRFQVEALSKWLESCLQNL